ncbi:uncharacterized protein BDV14DRAFT_179334 [Aspergillus stella-maris]|uniref:uncharacterized protein n=1 Tax=Aspergillus stella-maris TaxID=1810926 RepID=UPI003CCCB0EB
MHVHNAPYNSLLKCLATLLPNSGPLLRRIQYEARHPTTTAQVLASFPDGEDLSTFVEAGKPWFAAFVDVFRGLETQVYVFSSLETKNKDTVTIQERDIAKGQLLDLFTYIRRNLTPKYLDFLSSQPAPSAPAEREEGVAKIPAHPTTSVLLGSANEIVVGLLVELDSETAKERFHVHRGQHHFYAKYCFSSSAFESITSDSSDVFNREGAGYTFVDSNGVAGIQEGHIPLVKKRTNIPRSKETLLAMGGVALYHRPTSLPSQASAEGNEMPIAWAFLGFDGSLCTLHVEAEHRGKGLGGVVGKEVMKRGGDVFGSMASANGKQDEVQEWFFADVSIDNTASRRVMEKMGGEARWNVAWVVVEVDMQ